MPFSLGQTYSRRQVSDAIGGSTVAFLPSVESKIVAGCFKREPRWNPDAPEEVVFGPGPKVRESAELVARQHEAIPVFLFRNHAAWEYVGDYRCVKLETNPVVCREKERVNPKRGEICGVLYFRPV